MTRMSLAVATCLLLGACAATPDAGTGAAATPAAAPGAATAAATPAATAMPADAALSCDQITSQVASQNAIVNSAGAASAAAHKGTTTSQTAGVSAMSEMDAVRAAAADRKGLAATTRANQLVAMGKQKHCFAN
ncbi:MAG: hypothetical protein ACRYGC_00565 [Janthinobacterium lividum]